MEFEPVIGLEAHIQLSTNSKIFGRASAKFGGEPNEFVDPVTLGLPGSLPVLNVKVVQYAVMLGIATNCEIRNFNRFARKHYFYPDLPKGYQISQFDEPICERGSIKININDSSRSIGIKRIHMEEDAGKNIHDTRTESSLVDLNRAGIPLLEMVSEPDIRTPSEASAYLKAVRQLICYLGISDGNMEEGSFRCDANISLRKVGELKFGTRTEIKNLNSFKFVERALEYEIARQMSILKSGKEVIQETLLFESGTGTTKSMRSKEESSDYRYFPDPDLPPLEISQSFINDIKSKMPKLPGEALDDLVKNLGLSKYDATVLTSEKESVDYFYEVLTICPNAKIVCNWITSELFGVLNKKGVSIGNSPIKSQDLGSLLQLIHEEKISGKIAKTVFEEMYISGKTAIELIAEKGLTQITDTDTIRSKVQEAFKMFPTQLEGYLAGNEKLHGFFVGQVMKLTSGSGSPKMINDIIRNEAKKSKS